MSLSLVPPDAGPVLIKSHSGERVKRQKFVL